MALAFITTNQYKFREASAVLQSLGIGLDHVDMTYAESHDLGLEKIARASAERLASELDREVVTEDTGLFFTAFDGFPGASEVCVEHTGVCRHFQAISWRKQGGIFQICRSVRQARSASAII